MRPVVAACVLAWALLTGPAQAEAVEEFWPEVAVYKTLSPETRLFLDLPFAGNPDARKATLDIAAYLDISLLPSACIAASLITFTGQPNARAKSNPIHPGPRLCGSASTRLRPTAPG